LFGGGSQLFSSSQYTFAAVLRLPMTDWRKQRVRGSIRQAWRGGTLPPGGLGESLGVHFHGMGVFRQLDPTRPIAVAKPTSQYLSGPPPAQNRRFPNRRFRPNGRPIGDQSARLSRLAEARYYRLLVEGLKIPGTDIPAEN
jgi:hypothetical protein